MRSILFLLLGFLLFPLLASGEPVQWEGMERPYFVYSVTGISVGWYEGTQHTYMIASDLDDIRAYCTLEDGAEHWDYQDRQRVRAGATRISSSRNDGRKAAAIVPSGAGPQTGVHFTDDGGQSWIYREDEPGDPWEQPANRKVICVGMHPNSTDLIIVGCEQNDPLSTMWLTIDGGLTWTLKVDPDGRYWDRTNSIRFPPNDPGSPGYRNFYACRDVTGLWMLKEVGSYWWWYHTPNPYGSGDYDALDFAKCPSRIQRNYMLTRRNDIHKLWFAPHVLNGPWTEVYDFGAEAILEILDTSESEHVGVTDTVWVMSSQNIYMFEIDLNDPTIFTMETFPAGNDRYAWMDYVPSGGVEGDYPAIYVAREYSMEKLKYNTDYSDWMWEYRLKGTNAPNIAGISEGIGTIAAGAGLYALGEEGGYVFANKKLRDSSWPNDWEFKNSLLEDPQVSSATGIDVSSYYDGVSVKSIAIGSGQEGSETYWIAINNGQPVTFDDAHGRDPTSLDACAGRRNPYAVLEGKPYIGGKYAPDDFNIVWKLTTETYANIFYEDFSPLFTDLILLEDSYEQDFNPLGVGTRGWGDHKAIYITGFNEEIYLDNGLGWAYSLGAVAQSDERFSEGIAVLYAGPDDFGTGYGGIYKNHFDLQSSTSWYQAVNGMRDDIDMLSITTTKHLIDCGEPLDAIVVYALAQDPSADDRYMYVSADSGRSWIEIGQYLRDYQVHVSRLELIKDVGSQQEYFVAAAGEDGIYRYPYNVKSGTLAGNESWGPGLIIVNGDVTIPYGATLTIQEGTEVLFTYNFDRLSAGISFQKSELVVQGALTAEGIEGNQITFRSSKPSDPGPGDWYGIRAGVGSTVNLDYCSIEHAEIGLRAGYASQIVVENCTIKNNTVTGINLSNAPNGTTISNSRIENCGTYGIYCLGGSFTASGDTIANNRYGVDYSGYDVITIQDCLITYPELGPSSSYYGIRISDFVSCTPEPHILNDSIAGFDQGGIYFDGVTSTSARIEATSVYNCGKSGIYFKNSSAEINGGAATTRNLLASNSYGLNLTSGSSPRIRRTKFLDNSYRGVEVASGCAPDLGTMSDAGNNSFIKLGAIGPSYKHLYNHNLLWLNAIYNFWSPLDPSLIVNANYIPYLATDPLPKLMPDWDRTPLAEDFALAKSYPNPFNPATTILFNVSSPKSVTVKVFNIMGQEVRNLFAGEGSAGQNTVVWDGRNEEGRPVAAGVYLVQMRTGDTQKTIKTTVLR
jgi:parallel beta-helix repeat protein